MFIENLATINKKKLLDSVPKFEQGFLYYSRREKENYFSFAVKNGKTQELLMNGTAWEILELCDGKRSILDVVEDYKDRYEYLKNNADYMRDVIVTLYRFDKLWLLSWGKDGTPFMVTKEIAINGGYTLRWAKEIDIRDIAAAYEKYIGCTGYSMHNCPQNKYKGLSDYQKETVLRSKMFFYKEDFFLLKDKENETIGIMSICNNHPETDVLEITTMIVPDEAVQAVLTGLKQIIKENYIFDLNKLRLKTISSDIEEGMEAILFESTFNKSAVLKDEYGKDNDLLMFDYFFEVDNMVERK